MHKTTTIISSLVLCLLALRGYTDEEGNDEPPQIRKLRVALQAKHADLPTVSVNTRQEDVSFTTIDLSPSLTTIEDMNFYAFQFTTPKERAPLVWSFKFPKGASQWYIFPAKGQMRGFTNFSRRRLQRDVPDLGARGDEFILQQLPADNLQPATDYIIWLGISENNDPKLTLSLNVLWPKARLGYLDIFPMLDQKPSNKPDAGAGK